MREHEHPGLLIPIPKSHKVCLLNTDCHLDLNERCIQDQSIPYTICGCGHAFVRNDINNVCELKRGIKLVIKFASLPFVHEYFRNNTPAFVRLKELAEVTLNTVIQSSQKLSECVKDVSVTSFRSSMSGNNSNSVESETLIYITNSLYTSIKARETSLALVFVKEISISVHDLNRTKFHTNPEFDLLVTEIEADIDPCHIPDLNYCSQESSVCLRHEKDNMFRCECRDRFTDQSPHPLFPGEVCSLECPDDYCSNDGHCHVDRRSSDLYCTCNHWNVGSRCQYDGIIVVSVLAVIVILLLLVVGCTASAFCSGRRSSDHIDHHRITSFPRSATDNSSQNLVQAKPSLLSSSCGDDHVRPFRITIDNLNYGSDQHATPVVQFSPTSLVAPSHRDSCHSGHNQQHAMSNLTSPAPSPRPSISAAVQTENLFDSLSADQLHQQMSSSSLEVALDKPARGLRAPGIDKSVESRPAGRLERLDNGISWC